MALKLLFWLSLRFRPGHQVQYVDKAQDSCRNFLATDPAAQLCGYLATGQPCKPVHRFCQPENLHVIATAATHSLSTVLSPRQGRPRHRSDDWPRDGAYDMQRFLMKPLSLKVFVNLNSVEASIRQRTTPPPRTTRHLYDFPAWQASGPGASARLALRPGRWLLPALCSAECR